MTITPTITINSLACPLSGTVTVSDPEGIALDGSGNIYVADDALNTVDVFNSNGTTLTQVGGGSLAWPVGVAVDGNGLIYVTDMQSNEVNIFNLQGSSAATWSGTGAGNGTFDSPAGIAANAASTLVYVADSGNNMIDEFNTEGKFLYQWGGWNQGTFSNPWGVAVDRQGWVYVADTGNSQVEVFTGQGSYIREWSTAQIGGAELIQWITPTS